MMNGSLMCLLGVSCIEFGCGVSLYRLLVSCCSVKFGWLICSRWWMLCR